MSKQAYYAARAIAERRQAQAATDSRVATVHAELSARYEALSLDPSLEPPGDDLTVAEPRDSELAESEQPTLEPSTAFSPGR